MSALRQPAPANALGHLADTIGHARTLEELVRPLLEVLEAITGMESTYLTSIDAAADQQTVMFARNTRSLQIPESLTVPWQDTLCRRALDEGRMYTDDVASRWGDSEAARALGIRTYASAPVRLEDGRLFGTLCAASATSRPISEDAGHALRLFSGLISQQLEREHLLQQLKTANAALSASLLTDPVTSMPNRRALLQELAHRMASHAAENESLLVAFIDLDGFKAINDRHGHAVGDQFLAAMGDALRRGLRPGDFVARLGGDEFVALATVPADTLPRALDDFRDRLERCSTGEFVVGGVTVDYAGASIGVVAAAAGEADMEALVARADAAMYAAKRVRRTP